MFPPTASVTAFTVVTFAAVVTFVAAVNLPAAMTNGPGEGVFRRPRAPVPPIRQVSVPPGLIMVPAVVVRILTLPAVPRVREIL